MSLGFGKYGDGSPKLLTLPLTPPAAKRTEQVAADGVTHMDHGAGVDTGGRRLSKTSLTRVSSRPAWDPAC